MRVSGLMNKKIWAGFSFLAAGLFLAREFFVWLFNKALDNITSSFGQVIYHLSLQTLISLFLIIAGVILIFLSNSKSKINNYTVYNELLLLSVNIVIRIRKHRSAKWHSRNALEPLSDITRSGASALLSFQKAGFTIPVMEVDNAEQAAFGMEIYLSTLAQLLKDKHYVEAKEIAPELSSRSESLAKLFNVQDWHQNTY